MKEAAFGFLKYEFPGENLTRNTHFSAAYALEYTLFNAQIAKMIALNSLPTGRRIRHKCIFRLRPWREIISAPSDFHPERISGNPPFLIPLTNPQICQRTGRSGTLISRVLPRRHQIAIPAASRGQDGRVRVKTPPKDCLYR